MTIETIATAKAVSAGSLSVLFVGAFSDAEFLMLFVTGAFASAMSYFYDWAHREPPMKFHIKEFMELFKAIFYGIPMMFIVYYYGIGNTSEFVNVPVTVWGFVAMLAAGSAVTIVEWFAPLFGSLVHVIMLKRGEK